jgi:ABC-type dipeptide transport system, periplasmic component
MTAEDVKATYESVLDPANVSPHRITLDNIQGMETHGADTIDFHLQRADPLFPGRLVIGVLPARLIRAGHQFSRSPVGSGPLRLLSWRDDNQLTLERISDRQLIRFITVQDSTVRVLKLLRGEIDLIQGELPFELLHWLSGMQGMVVKRERGDTFAYLGFNMQDPALAQLMVRKAIAHAIDRDAIIQYVLGGAARKADSLLPPDHWAGHTGLNGYAFDPMQSRTLLAAAGYDESHPLQITYKTSNNPLRVRIATILQYQLRQVGSSGRSQEL